MNSDQVFDEDETTKKKLVKVRVNCFYEKECYRESKAGAKNRHIGNVVAKQPIVSSSITSNLNDEVQRHKKHFVKKLLISCFGMSFDDEVNKSLKNKLPNFCFSQPENNVPDIVTKTVLSEDFVNTEPLSKPPFNKSFRTKSLASTDSSEDSADIVQTCPDGTASGRDFVNIIPLSKSPVQRSSRIKSFASTDGVVVSAGILKTNSTNLDSDVSELKKGVTKPLDKPKCFHEKKNHSNFKSSEQISFSKKYIETQIYDTAIQLLARDGSLRLYSTRTLAPLDCTAIYDYQKIAKYLKLTYANREISPDSESVSSKEFSSGSDNVFTEDNIPNPTTLTQEASRMKSNWQKNFRKSTLQAFSSENQSSLYSEAIKNGVHEKASQNIYKQTHNFQSSSESTKAGFDTNAERYVENSHGLCFEQTLSKGVHGSFSLANTYNNSNTTPILDLHAFSTTQHENVDETRNFKTQFPEVKQIAPLVNETQQCRQNPHNKDSFKYFNYQEKYDPFRPMNSVSSNKEKVKDFAQQEPNKHITTKGVQQTKHRSLSAYPRKGRHLASVDPEGCDQRNVFRNIYQRQRSASFGDDTVLTYYQFIDGPLANKLRPYSVRGKMRPTEN